MMWIAEQLIYPSIHQETNIEWIWGIICFKKHYAFDDSWNKFLKDSNGKICCLTMYKLEKDT